jgi:hypothetical protein
MHFTGIDYWHKDKGLGFRYHSSMNKQQISKFFGLSIHSYPSKLTDIIEVAHMNRAQFSQTTKEHIGCERCISNAKCLTIYHLRRHFILITSRNNPEVKSQKIPRHGRNVRYINRDEKQKEQSKPKNGRQYPTLIFLN